MLTPLLLMGVGFTLYFAALLLIRMRGALLARRARALTTARLHRAAT